MAHRPIQDKQIRRLEKAIKRQPLTRYVNLIDWLLDRRFAQTKGGARQLLTTGKVKADSHVVGRKKREDGLWWPAPLLPVKLQKGLHVER